MSILCTTPHSTSVIAADPLHSGWHAAHLAVLVLATAGTASVDGGLGGKPVSRVRASSGPRGLTAINSVAEPKCLSIPYGCAEAICKIATAHSLGAMSNPSRPARRNRRRSPSVVVGDRLIVESGVLPTRFEGIVDAHPPWGVAQKPMIMSTKLTVDLTDAIGFGQHGVLCRSWGR